MGQLVNPGTSKIDMLTPREDTEVCQEKYAYKGTVTNEHSLEIHLWYRRGTEFQAECFMWCTAEGGLPEIPEEDVDIDTGWLISIRTGNRIVISFCRVVV